MEGDEHVALLDSLSLKELTLDGADFEIDTKVMEQDEEASNVSYFSPDAVYYEDSTIPLDFSDEDDEDTSISVFEKTKRKMEDISPSKDGSVYKRIKQHGYGPVCPEMAYVRLHYDAFLEYHDEPYDSSRLRQQEEKYHLGQGETFEGLEIAILSMRKGERSEFIFSPECAYGPMGCPPRIPQNATLLFNIELLDFTEKAGVNEYFAMTHRERKDASWEIISRIVTNHRKEAKEVFKKKNFKIASQKYRKIIDILQGWNSNTDVEHDERQQILLKMYSYAALCGYKSNQLSWTFECCREILLLNPDCAKAYYFRGRAFMQQYRTEEAMVALRKAERLKPGDEDIINAIKDIKKTQERNIKLERETCQKMFGIAKNASPVNKHSIRIDEDVNIPSTEFTETLELILTNFVNGPELELAYPTNGLSKDEIMQILIISKKMKVKCEEYREGDTDKLLFKKNNLMC